jgi:RimJ/RimL family protein N-acetyltransferase
MTAIAPKLETRLVKPMLIDYVTVCQRLPAIERRQWEALTDGEPFDAERAALALANLDGPKWALVTIAGEALAVAGLSYVRPEVWQEWLIASELAWSLEWRTITRHCKRAMDRMLETEARRIQCVCLSEKKLARQWYHVLGFRHEGTLRAYGANGEDCEMYARIAEGPNHGRR